MRKFVRRLASFALALSLCSAGVAAPAPAPADLKDVQSYDPMLAQFAKLPWAPPRIDWRIEDLDEDSFFMGSQSFVGALGPVDASRTRVRDEPGQISIQVAGTDRALEIRRPLRPLAEVENFLFFAATDAALFKNSSAQGVFFLDVSYLYAELARGPHVPRRPVPIFFLPLDGRWTGPLDHVAVEPFTTLALRNPDGRVQTFDLDALRKFAKVLHLNVQLATLLGLKGDPGAARAVDLENGLDSFERPFARPPRGSTAFFGTLLTGVNLDDPARGVTDVARVTGYVKPKSFTWLPRAHALVLAPDVWDRLYVTAMLSAGVWSLSTFVQMTTLRERVLTIRRELEETEDRARLARGRAPPDRTRASYRALRFARENVGIFSTGLAALGSGAETLATYPVEYLSDASGLKAARSGWWRKLIERTFIYYRNINENVITNWKAFYLGVAILGSVDTSGVVLELLWLSPIVFPALAGLISPQLRAQVQAQFSGGDEVTNDLVASEIMRNASLYWILGSYLYAGDQRSALMEIVRPEVERAFIKRGLNPHDPANERAVQDEIEVWIERLLVERGLPSRRQFLFSSPSLVRAMAGAIGYRIDPRAVERSRDFDGTPPTFALAWARHGLIAGTFKHARAGLRAELERQTAGREPGVGDSLRRAEYLLGELQRRHRAVRLMARDPRRMNAIGREAYKVNQILTLFTAEGLVGGGLKYMDLWTPEDPAPLERLVHLKHELDARDRRLGIKRSRRARFRLMKDAVANESPAVAEAFAMHAGRGRTLESVLAEVRADRADGVLGAALRDPRAAEIAGRAFRQTFFARVADRPDWMRPREDDIALYGDQARAEALAKLRAAPADLDFDAADVELEALELIKEKVAARELAARVAAWTPPKPDWLESFRIAKSHREAMLEVSRQLGADYRVTAADVASLGEGGPAASPAVTTIYREAYRLALARRGGLHPIENDPVDRGAREAADHDVAANLANNPSWRGYLGRLDPVERLRFVSHQYAEAYLTRYVEMTVGNSSLVPLTSPSQPGFFQKWRQSELPSRDTRLGRTLTTLLRVGDAMFDATSVRSDLKSTIKRRVPFAQDLISDTSQRARRLVILFGVTWWVNWYLWGVHYDLPTMLLFFGTGGLSQIAHYFVDRMLLNTGVPPMTGTWAKVKYSVLVTLFTYPSYAPFFFFEKSWRSFFNAWVTTPLGHAAGVARDALDACQAYLGQVF